MMKVVSDLAEIARKKAIIKMGIKVANTQDEEEINGYKEAINELINDSGNEADIYSNEFVLYQLLRISLGDDWEHIDRDLSENGYYGEIFLEVLEDLYDNMNVFISGVV